MNPQQLRHELEQFYGTEHWYVHPLNRKITYTDGVKFFADAAGCHWLLDILVTEVAPLLKKEPFLAVTLAVAGDDTAVISADDGDGRVVWRRDVDFTDAPEGEWLFYMTDGVILLPSEY